MTLTSPSNPALALSFGLTFSDLYQDDGLNHLQDFFLHHLNEHDPDLCQRYLVALQQCAQDVEIVNSTRSTLLLELAPHLEDFIGILFGIQRDIKLLQEQHYQFAPLFTVKRQFIQRFAVRKYAPKDLENFEAESYRKNFTTTFKVPFTELHFAQHISTWMNEDQNSQDKDFLEEAAKYCAWAALTEKGQSFHKEDILFHLPKKLNFEHLVDSQRKNHVLMGQQKNQRLRDGFALTDQGFSRVHALDQANYCIWCHHQGKDSCSKGSFPKKPEENSDRFQKNIFQTPLTGCPLGQKISEMNETKAQGYAIGSLSIILVDNPMVAATGHRICNDCMKACIYQKQDPVNIPGTETRILNDVLNLPWGFEIYSLLSRWNPLNLERPLPRSHTNYKVLIVGLGPAGFTLAHHLLNEGHAVVAIDGLKIEPLDSKISGVDPLGNRTFFQPIYNIDQLKEPLQERIQGGFGGVAEYGITVRWDKNYLKIVRLLLERRQTFSMIGGVRFGGTLTIQQAIDLGFDHIALCMGAGSPTLLPLVNGLATGVRQASDFLMALQLTGASKETSLTNLQVALPAVVIGGGLTAIDTATEVMAYYPVQVEKIYNRYQTLCNYQDEETIRKEWAPQELPLLNTFLTHGRAIVQERKRALEAREKPNFQKLVQSWGGVTLVYRRELTQAPSYRLNHEEVEKALEEGIYVMDQATPLGVDVNTHGQACALQVTTPEGLQTLPAQAIFIAAGTKPNINLRYDEPNLPRSGNTFQAINETNEIVYPERLAKPEHVHVLLSALDNNKYLSFFGDMHPSFAGNVVKAMGSAKQGYPTISRVLKRTQPTQQDFQEFFSTLNEVLRPQITHVNRLTPTIVEVIIKAPQGARNFKPGQFYRLQNFETLAPTQKGTKLLMEGIALTGASVNLQEGTLSTIVLEMGGSSNLCQSLKVGEPVVLMGPTGSPTEIPHNKTVLLAGGGLGNAVLFSIGQAMRNQGCKVLYFAGYKKREDRYKVSAIEQAADQIIWCCDEAPGFTPSRPQDLTYVGNIVEAMVHFAQGKLGQQLEPLEEVDHLLVIGSDGMMGAMAKAQQTVLKPYLIKVIHAYASINSPMQCMMKEICAQCLQRHVDPITGEEKIVYSCVQQDQDLAHVDFKNLSQRLKQNSVQEKLTKLWLAYCLNENEIIE